MKWFKFCINCICILLYYHWSFFFLFCYFYNHYIFHQQLQCIVIFFISEEIVLTGNGASCPLPYSCKVKSFRCHYIVNCIFMVHCLLSYIFLVFFYYYFDLAEQTFSLMLNICANSFHLWYDCFLLSMTSVKLNILYLVSCIL